MRAFWIHSGLALLDVAGDDGLHITDDFIRAYFLRPELAPVEESCPLERGLHERFLDNPRREIDDGELDAIADQDTAQNYRLFLRFRDRLLGAPDLQSAYIRMHSDAQESGRIDVPPMFVDQLTQILLHHMMTAEQDPIVLRAAEIWFREQRVMLDEGRVVVADAQTVTETADPGMGDLGRMLAAGGLAAGEQSIEVLHAQIGESYFGRDEEFDFALEITHGRPGSTAIAKLIELWVLHMLGAKVKVRSIAEIDDDHWRWHVGLDAQASGLLDSLYKGESLDPDDHRRLLLLLRLDFEDLAEQRKDVAGKPVYLALAMDKDGVLRLKPQNLLFNLPLAERH